MKVLVLLLALYLVLPQLGAQRRVPARPVGRQVSLEPPSQSLDQLLDLYTYYYWQQRPGSGLFVGGPYQFQQRSATTLKFIHVSTGTFLINIIMHCL